jgi:hypothetical protein
LQMLLPALPWHGSVLTELVLDPVPATAIPACDGAPPPAADDIVGSPVAPDPASLVAVPVPAPASFTAELGCLQIEPSWTVPAGQVPPHPALRLTASQKAAMKPEVERRVDCIRSPRATLVKSSARCNR